MNRIPFAKEKSTGGIRESRAKSKEQAENTRIIMECCKYLSHAKKRDAVRDYDIDMAAADYTND